MKPIIEVKNISKSYALNRTMVQTTLRENVTGFLTHPLATMEKLRNIETFWALDDVSFKVMPGEILGLLGHNGAGKSTLLKIMSRITPPTQGDIFLRGRVGSLLEVGTGFSLELTGRENIYLYGAILGMRQSEIKKKFDEIVDFSEVEKFLDTPLKHYSSGMYVRLAFAVASHLDCEILLVDEVLAVGDVSFQEKSIKKMGQVTQSGKTIILVSHNLNLISSIADRSVLLHSGKLVFDGNTDSAIEKYLKIFRTQPIKSSSALSISQIVLTNATGKVVQTVTNGEKVGVEIEYQANEPIEKPFFWINIKDRTGAVISASMMVDGQGPSKIKGSGKIRCLFESLPLIPGMYGLEVGIKDSKGHEDLFYIENALHFKVTSSDKKNIYQTPLALKWLSSEHATSIVTPYHWKM